MAVFRPRLHRGFTELLCLVPSRSAPGMLCIVSGKAWRCTVELTGGSVCLCRVYRKVREVEYISRQKSQKTWKSLRHQPTKPDNEHTTWQNRDLVAISCFLEYRLHRFMILFCFILWAVKIQLCIGYWRCFANCSGSWMGFPKDYFRNRQSWFSQPTST
jgi:hypothetical protein